MFASVVLFLALLTGAFARPAAADPAPLLGCYARVYDSVHLAAHKGQIVLRVSLSVTDARPETRVRESHTADANLRIWVRGRKQSFDSHGACDVAGDGLRCGGSLSAAEADTCRKPRDGVHDCRIDTGSDPGSFAVQPKPEGVLVSVRERLELVPAPYDAGPFLYLSPGNAENRSFLLKRTACP
jgi:hypothetical protein